MTLYLICLVFFCSDLIVRLALRQRSHTAIELVFVCSLSLAWLLYPELSNWALPYMPRNTDYGMAIYAVLVGLQLGLMDGAVRTWLARWRRSYLKNGRLAIFKLKS